MNITLTGNKIVQDTKFLAFEKNSNVDVINITVDTDESWEYKLDVRYPDKCCSGETLYNIINLTRNGNVCTTILTSDMLPFSGKYTMQIRGINGDKIQHSDTFDAWVKYSIEPGTTYNPVPSEFYQIEQNVTEMNNHPPKPGENGYWLIWDVTTQQYKESDIPLPDGTLPNITADTSGKYLSNDGKKAYWAEVQAGTESKIDKIEVNGVEQPIVDKTVNIAVPTKMSQLDNDSGFITEADVPVKSVNGKTGEVTLDAKAVGALPDTTVIPSKTSELDNDSGYITEVALEPYAKTTDVPTKTSQLNNDSGFITDAALTGYAKTTDIPTKTSQLDNDSHYITASEAPVQSVDGATGNVVTNAVKTTAQTLTDTQKQQARDNIGVVDVPTPSAENVGKIPVSKQVGDGYEYVMEDKPTSGLSLGITGASTGQSPIINTVDADGKPMVWEAAVLAKADGSNIIIDAMDTWRTRIAALPGVKVYGKADADGKIKAYIDADCTQEVEMATILALADYGNALLIYDHKTYQCVGFEEPASMQGSGNYLVAVFFRSEITTDSAGVAVLKVETAKLNIIEYLSGAINAPIIITAGDLSLTTTTTT